MFLRTVVLLALATICTRTAAFLANPPVTCFVPRSQIGSLHVLRVSSDEAVPSRRIGTTVPEPRWQVAVPHHHVCEQTGVTLSRYILDNIRANPKLQGIDSIFTALQTACKAISQLIRNAHFNGMTGLQDGGGSVNVQGEEQKKLDVATNNVLKNALKWSGKFSSLASEEEEHPVPLVDSMGREFHSSDVVVTTDANSGYVAVFDPLDGSSNVDASVPTGTIFGIFASEPESKHVKIAENVNDVARKCLEGILQPGRNLVAAGYCLYSSAVILVLTLGCGVMGFTLDERIGEFRLTHPHLVVPARGKIYSFNEANKPDWDATLQDYISDLQHGRGQSQQRYASRYIGSMVGDVHRTLLYGGIFGYPDDTRNPNGKLRLLYEATPMAFVVEQAGGRAVTGHQRILDIVPETVHQRVPCILGSPEDVDECRSYIEKTADELLGFPLIFSCITRSSTSLYGAHNALLTHMYLFYSLKTHTRTYPTRLHVHYVQVQLSHRCHGKFFVVVENGCWSKK